MQYAYPCALEPETDPDFEGMFNVSFPDIKGAFTCGRGRKHALEMAEDCLLVALCGFYVDCGEELPKPSKLKKGQELVAVPPLAAAKLALYAAMRRQLITPAELAYRTGLSLAVVRRLLLPDRDSHSDHIAKALDAVGCRLLVQDLAA